MYANICGHSFLNHPAWTGDNVWDLGAYQGRFTCGVFPSQMNVTMVEPFLNQRLVKTSIAMNNLLLHGVIDRVRGGIDLRNVWKSTSIPKASSMLWRRDVHNDGGMIRTVGYSWWVLKTLVGEPSMVKMDIEGSEINILPYLKKDDVLGLRQLTVEFHEWLGMYEQWKVDECVDNMVSLGFTMMRFSPDDWSDVLFVRGEGPTGWYRDLVVASR